MTDELIKSFSTFDKKLAGLKAKDCVFCITGMSGFQKTKLHIKPTWAPASMRAVRKR